MTWMEQSGPVCKFVHRLRWRDRIFSAYGPGHLPIFLHHQSLCISSLWCQAKKDRVTHHGYLRSTRRFKNEQSLPSRDEIGETLID